jgi:hypothetical protein
MFSGAGHALNRIVRRKAVIAEELPDFIVGRGLVYIAYPEITHCEILR